MRFAREPKGGRPLITDFVTKKRKRRKKSSSAQVGGVLEKIGKGNRNPSYREKRKRGERRRDNLVTRD